MKRCELQLESGPETLAEVRDFMRSALTGYTEAAIMLTVELVVEELVTNTLKHGYREFSGPLRVECQVGEGECTFILADRAATFDPTARSGLPEEETEGGRGLPLVRELTTSFSYERTMDGWNIITCTFTPGGCSPEEEPPSDDPAETEGNAAKNGVIQAGDGGDPAGDGGNPVGDDEEAALAPPSPLEAPRLKEGVTLTPLQQGAVLVEGPGLDTWITDEGTATVLEVSDGRGVDEIAAELNKRFNWGMTGRAVSGLLERWAKWGYLDGTPTHSDRLLRADPARLLRLLTPLTRLYGRRLTALAAGALALAALILTVMHGPRVVAQYGQIARLHPVWGAALAILGYYLGYSVTAFFHELGHALAVHRHGGEVPEIGIRRNFNFFVLANRDILLTPADRIWYYAGGLLSDTVWWFGAWVWWLAAPGPLPLFLLVPQTVYFLLYAWAPSGYSDAALVLREAVGWTPLARIRRGTDWRERWKEAPLAQRALELVRLTLGGALIVFIALSDLYLIVLYIIYRLLRKGLNRL